MGTLKGIIHCHSCYSFDSIVTIKEIIQYITQYNLDFLILSDHNTVAGSISLRKKLKKHGLSHVQVPVAAEYNTEYGDIIAAFINAEIDYTQPFEQVTQEIKKQNGIVLFPHPYKGHKYIEKIATEADLIEVFNSRDTDHNNQKSVKLAKEYEKSSYWASDAHMLKEYDYVIVEIEYNTSNLKEALLFGQIKPVSQIKTTYFNILYSQFIKSLKTKNMKLLILIVLSAIKKLFKNILFNPIK
tara:strand:- start:227 stop:952 length:726 start_codon:yes stop_codon:yes gene_type:complete